MLMAEDMDRAVAFYRDTMGFEQGFLSAHWSELRFGDAILGLHGGWNGSLNETGLSIQYEDVSMAFGRAIAAGATIIEKPQHRDGEPILLATIRDPEGNTLMLTQYVGDR